MRGRSGQASTGRRVPLQVGSKRYRKRPSRSTMPWRPRWSSRAGSAPERRLQALVTPGAAVAAAMQGVEPIRGDSRAAVHHAEGREALRVPGGEGHGVVPAHGMAGQRHPLPAHRGHHGQQIGGEIFRGIGGPRGPVALSVAALVQGEDVEAPLEGRHHGVEPVGMGRAAVEKAEGRPARCRPLEAPQREPVHRECPARCTLTGVGAIVRVGRSDRHAPHCSAGAGRGGAPSCEPDGEEISFR